jgi:CHAT domain-containing protein
MIKFYENFRQSSQREAGAVAVALNQAQKWLRNLTTQGWVLKYNPCVPERTLA